MKKLFLFMFAICALASCTKVEDDTSKSIELMGGTSITQTVYADQTSSAASDIKFNAPAPWTASVVAVTKADENGADWLTLSAYKGEAGEHTLTMTFSQNTTGADRKAEIRLVCGGTTITITVEQKGTTQGGELPQPTVGYLTADGKITGGEIFGDKIPTEISWMLIRMDTDNDDTKSPTSYPYANKNFTITLPTPAANQLGGFTENNTPSLTMTPNDMKFTSAMLEFTNGFLELTNIAPQNVNDADNYRIKMDEGYIRFMYASKAGVVSGTFMETESKQTFVFTNCSFRQGWNEMVMLAAQDAATDGSVTINVTTNNAPTTFKWVAKSDDEVEPEPEPSSGIVKKINGEAIEYHSDYVFSRIGEKNYVNKSYSETEWSYVSRDATSRYDDWRCHFAYGTNRLVDFTEYYSTKDDSDSEKTKYQWEGEKLTAVLDYDYLENGGVGMRLDIEYGGIEYTKGNIDMNWLVVHAKYRGNGTFMTPWESAIGIRSVPYRNLISKIVVTDLGEDKYSATCTFQYDRDAQGYITKIHEHIVYKLGGNTNDMVIYEFEY